MWRAWKVKTLMTENIIRIINIYDLFFREMFTLYEMSRVPNPLRNIVNILRVSKSLAFIRLFTLERYETPFWYEFIFELLPVLGFIITYDGFMWKKKKESQNEINLRQQIVSFLLLFSFYLLIRKRLYVAAFVFETFFLLLFLAFIVHMIHVLFPSDFNPWFPQFIFSHCFYHF